MCGSEWTLHENLREALSGDLDIVDGCLWLRNLFADFTHGTDSVTFASGMFSNNAANVLAATHDDGHGNTVITVDANNSITLHHVVQAQLSASDFHFA